MKRICQSCHGPNGEGGLLDDQGNLGFPALKEGDWYNRPELFCTLRREAREGQVLKIQH